MLTAKSGKAVTYLATLTGLGRKRLQCISNFMSAVRLAIKLIWVRLIFRVYSKGTIMTHYRLQLVSNHCLQAKYTIKDETISYIGITCNVMQYTYPHCMHT